MVEPRMPIQACLVPILVLVPAHCNNATMSGHALVTLP